MFNYILAYISAHILNVIAQVPIVLFLGYVVSPASQITLIFEIFSSIITSVICLSILIFVYSLFKSLELRKVIIWLWILGGIGTIQRSSYNATIYNKLNFITQNDLDKLILGNFLICLISYQNLFNKKKSLRNLLVI